MSILRPWPSKRRSDWPAGHSRRARTRWGFTLIELLVVVAILALLISILLPSLSSAREQARAVVCGQHLHQFGAGLQIYLGENKDFIPGINTSGVTLTAKRFTMNTNPSVLFRPKVPVQTFDWMTPILTYSLELPALRSERFKYLITRYRCPSQMYTAVMWDSSSGPDLDAFGTQDPLPATSYLMSAWFQYFGQNWYDQALTHDERLHGLPVLAKVADPEWEVRLDDYQGRLNQIGQAARKVFVADGTRYLDASLVLDYDCSPIADLFGAFTAGGAWWCGDRAYGVRAGSANYFGATTPTGSPSDGQNLPLSYRHGTQQGATSGDAHGNKGSINAVFFDGHVERMTDRQSREIGYWYPKGGKVQVPTEGMTEVPENYVIP